MVCKSTSQKRRTTSEGAEFAAAPVAQRLVALRPVALRQASMTTATTRELAILDIIMDISWASPEHMATGAE